MHNNLNKVGVAVIDGLDHYVYTRNGSGELYIVSSVEGSIIRVEPPDDFLRKNTPDIVEKAVELLERRLVVSSRRTGTGTGTVNKKNEVCIGLDSVELKELTK